MEEEPGSPAQAERLALQQMSGNGSKLHHDNEDEDEAKEVGQRRRIVIRKNTLLPHHQPPHYYQSRKASAGQAGNRKGSSTLLRRFDAVNSRTSQDLDLENMVKGVSSVSGSQVQDPDNVCSPRFDKASGAEGGQSSTKKRLTYGGQWLQKKCWWCLHRLRNWRNGSSATRPRRDSILSNDSLEERRQYWGPLIASKGGAAAAKPLFSKFKAEGHVTSACLWHACRAVTFGSLLIIMGITMAVLGFISDQKVYEDRLKNETHPIQKKNGPGLAEPVERFGLNNLSFAGPVIMGVGGFLIVAACVMTFEARDNAAKVVPATTNGNTAEEENQRTSLKEGADVLAWKAFSSFANPKADSSTSKEPRFTFTPEVNHPGYPSSNNLPLQAQFTSSSSQTTFLDRNIVHNLAVTSTVPVFTAAAIATSSSKLSSIGRTVTTTTTNACNARRRRPRTVPASYTSGSGGSCKRASSFSGTLPEVAGIEPGLALMDEIGRRALTDAFIRFTKETAKTHRFLYNPKEGDPHLGSPIENNENNDHVANQVKKGLDCHMEEDLEDEDLQSPGMAKCPSAPNIHQHKLYQPVPSMLVTPAAASAAEAAAKGNGHQNIQLDQLGNSKTQNTKKRHGKQSILRSDSSPNSKSSSASRVKLSLSPLPPTFENQSSMYSYRVLTPTMYRSRMATARQAVSMDYDDDSGAVKKARLRREGPAMRGPSPLLRPGKLLRAQRSSGENSFDLELGASATRVHQLPPANAKYKRLSPNVHQQLSTEHSGSSMMLDLHIEGAAPVTLLVRDESRSTRSTSFNREEDELSSSSPTRPLHPTSSEETAEDVGGPEGGQKPSAVASKIKKVSSLALQIVDSDSGEPLTLAEEIASFEFIDELASSDVTSGSSFSDLDDVWSPNEDGKATKHVSLKSKFLTHLEKNLLSIPARRASAESLSSPSINQSDKPTSINQEKTIKTSVSVTTELNRIPQMQRNVATRQSKLVRQKKVDLK